MSAGENVTARRADLFDHLSADAPLCLTAITRKSWQERVEEVDRILWHLAENLDRGKTCRAFKMAREELDALVAEADEPELARIK